MPIVEVRSSQSASFLGFSKRTEDQKVKGKKGQGKKKIHQLFLSITYEISTSKLVEQPVDIKVNLLAPTI